jgi:hypothetical protein
MIDCLTGSRKWFVFGLLLLCHVFFLQIYPHFVPPNEFTRLLLVSAIVDDHTVTIDQAIRRYGDTQDKSNVGDTRDGYRTGIPIYFL